MNNLIIEFFNRIGGIEQILGRRGTMRELLPMERPTKPDLMGYRGISRKRGGKDHAASSYS